MSCVQKTHETTAYVVSFLTLAFVLKLFSVENVKLWLKEGVVFL